MSVITLAQRLNNIKSHEDIAKQINLSDKYVKRLRNNSKTKCLTLAEKLSKLEQIKEAQAVTDQLKLLAFKIETALSTNICLLNLVNNSERNDNLNSIGIH